MGRSSVAKSSSGSSWPSHDRGTSDIDVYDLFLTVFWLLCCSASVGRKAIRPREYFSLQAPEGGCLSHLCIPQNARRVWQASGELRTKKVIGHLLCVDPNTI